MYNIEYSLYLTTTIGDNKPSIIINNNILIRFYELFNI